MQFTPDSPEIALCKPGRHDLHDDLHWLLRLLDGRVLRLSDTETDGITVEDVTPDEGVTPDEVRQPAPGSNEERDYLLIEDKSHTPWLVTNDLDERVVVVLGVNSPFALDRAAIFFGVKLDEVATNTLSAATPDSDAVRRWFVQGCPTIVDHFDYNDAAWRGEDHHP